MSFDLRTLDGEDRDVMLVCEQDGAPWTNYGAISCSIGTTSTTCTSTCTPPEGIVTKFGVFGGNDDVDYAFDNALLVQAIRSPSPSPTLAPPSGGDNLFANADFSSGLVGWNFYAPNSDYSIVSGGVLAEIDLAAETWPSQMGQTLEADGDEYVFAFNIRTEDPALSRTVRLICELDGAPYTKYGTAYCTINGVNTRCATACTPPAGTMTRFSVHGGQSVVDYVVASAELYSANGTPEPTPGPGPVLPETLEEYFTQTNQADRLAYFGFRGFGEAEVISRHFLHHMLSEDGLLNVFFTHVRPSSGTTYLESSEFWTNGMDWLYANNIINIAEYDGVFQDVFFNIALRPESRLVIMLVINTDVASVNEYTYNWDICVWNDKMVGRARNIALEYAMDEILTAPRFYSGLDSFKLHSSAWNLTGDGATIEPEEFSIVPIFDLINMAEDFVGPVGGAPSVERWQWVVYPAP